MSNCAEPNLASLDTGKIKISGYVNQINQILLPVSLGLGFTLLPQSAVASFIEQDRIDVYRPPSMVYETLYLIRKRSMELSQRVQFLNQEVRKAISH
ncbi:LysR substrate-binding domain-containing protein [Shewanella sp. JL219SE-S6]